jgi:FHA domain
VGFDSQRAVVATGDGVVARFPGILCVAQSPDAEALRDLLELCAGVAGADPGRALARRLATWMSGADAPPDTLRFGTLAAAGAQVAVFLVGAVDAWIDGPDGAVLSGADAAIGTDRLLPVPDAPLVLSAGDVRLPADVADVHDLRAGIVAGAGVVLHPARPGGERPRPPSAVERPAPAPAPVAAGGSGHDWFAESGPAPERSEQERPALRNGTAGHVNGRGSVAWPWPAEASVPGRGGAVMTGRHAILDAPGRRDDQLLTGPVDLVDAEPAGDGGRADDEFSGGGTADRRGPGVEATGWTDAVDGGSPARVDGSAGYGHDRDGIDPDRDREDRAEAGSGRADRDPADRDQADGDRTEGDRADRDQADRDEESRDEAARDEAACDESVRGEPARGGHEIDRNGNDPDGAGEDRTAGGRPGDTTAGMRVDLTRGRRSGRTAVDVTPYGVLSTTAPAPDPADSVPTGLLPTSAPAADVVATDAVPEVATVAQPVAPPTADGEPVERGPEADTARGDTDGDPAPTAALTSGYLCTNGHLADPRAPFCGVCGTPVDDRASGLVEGSRPPLGRLVFDDGATYTVDAGYLVGRMPEADDRVLSGDLRPIIVEDGTGSVSRVHAAIEISGWDVMLLDVGSRNGTFVAGPEEKGWSSLPAMRGRRLLPGTRVRLGGRTFVFESSSGVR